MDRKVYQERMRAKQRQLQRRRMMRKATYVIAAVLLLVFVVRGIIFPIINRIGGGSTNTEKPANVQAEADKKENGEGKAELTENTESEEDADSEENTEDGEAGDDSEEADTEQTIVVSDSRGSGIGNALRQPLSGKADLEKVLQMTAGWHEDINGKWYRNTDGTYYVSGFQNIDGKKYAFDDNGYIRTGWYISGSKEYWFEDDGVYDPKVRRPMLALTYDDGPGQYTDELLDCLEENNAKATFFMLGEHVSGYEDTIKRMMEIGCELGNHSYDHPNLYNVSIEEAQRQYARTDELLIEACGQPSTVARCPYGNGDSDIFNAVGKPFFMWSLDSLDWSLMDADMDYDKVMNGDLTDGTVILMHDIHQPSVKASLRIIPDLVAQGYRLVTVSELAEAKGVDLKYASYSDFWDSSLANGLVAGYRGEGWDDASEEESIADMKMESVDFADDSEYSEDGSEDFEEDYEG